MILMIPCEINVRSVEIASFLQLEFLRGRFATTG